MNVPVSYAYKLEGKDIDDGIENYEIEEKALADEALQLLEAELQDADFADEAIDSASKNEQQEADTNLLPCSAQEDLHRDLCAIVKQNLPFLKAPGNEVSRAHLADRLNLCLHSVVLIGLLKEEIDVEDHPILGTLNDLLVKVNSFKKTDAKAKKSISSQRKAKNCNISTQGEKIEADDDTRRLATREIVSNRGLTRLRPKDRKNPRLNQKRRYKMGMKKVRSTQRLYKPEDRGGFTGVKTLKPHIIRSQGLS